MGDRVAPVNPLLLMYLYREWNNSTIKYFLNLQSYSISRVDTLYWVFPPFLFYNTFSRIKNELNILFEY